MTMASTRKQARQLEVAWCSPDLAQRIATRHDVLVEHLLYLDGDYVARLFEARLDLAREICAENSSAVPVLPLPVLSGKPAKESEICNRVLRLVCSKYRISRTDLTGKKKERRCAFPRHVAAYLIRRTTSCDLKQISCYFSNLDHSGVLYAEKRIKQLCGSDAELKAEMEALQAAVLAGQ